MTTIDTARLRALADAATAPPWETRGYKEMPGKYVVGPRKPSDLGRGPVVLMEPLFCDERSAADAEFIAAARTAVPALLDALAEAEARVQAVRDACDDYSRTAIWGDKERIATSDIRYALDGEG